MSTTTVDKIEQNDTTVEVLPHPTTDTINDTTTEKTEQKGIKPTRGKPWSRVLYTNKESTYKRLVDYVEEKINAANPDVKGLGKRGRMDTSKYFIINEDSYDTENESTLDDGSLMDFDFVINNACSVNAKLVFEISKVAKEEPEMMQVVWLPSEQVLRFYSMKDQWNGMKDHEPVEVMDFSEIYADL